MSPEFIQAALIGFLLTFAGPYLRRKFYMRPLSGEAFVRVGLGGLRIVREREGCWFFSHFHIINRIPLHTFRLSITQRVITRDLREPTLDVSFFIRVLDHDDSLRSAARSLTGDPPLQSQWANPIRTITPSSIARLIQTRLETHVRIGAASATFEQMLSNEVHWLLEWLPQLSGDLSHYGLVIETMTVDRVSSG